MVEIYVRCSLMGKDFSPKRLEKMSSLKLIAKEEKGEIGRMGIYKGKSIPWGSASLGCSFSEKERAAGKSELDGILQLIKVNYECIKACGVEDINLALIIGYTGDGTCWYLEHKELKKIVDLGIGLSIDWYPIEDESSYPDDEKRELEALDLYQIWIKVILLYLNRNESGKMNDDKWLKALYGCSKSRKQG